MNTYVRILGLAALLTACHESSHTPSSPHATTAASQIERGGQLYGANCAKCHGDAGQGTDDAPPLIGKNALPLHPRPDQKVRKADFHSAMDIAGFVTKEMPPKASARAKLTTDDYWAILGFALNANGVQLKEPVGPNNAGSIVLHP
jgi:cytochrome c